jgi:hypothetical protein
MGENACSGPPMTNTAEWTRQNCMQQPDWFVIVNAGEREFLMAYRTREAAEIIYHAVSKRTRFRGWRLHSVCMQHTEPDGQLATVLSHEVSS